MTTAYKIELLNKSLLHHNGAIYLFIYYIVYTHTHRGLPPCRGGGAYAPMTRTII